MRYRAILMMVLALLMAGPAAGQQYIPYWIDVNARSIPAKFGMDVRETLNLSGSKSLVAAEAQAVFRGYGSIRYSYWPRIELNDTFLPNDQVMFGGQAFGKQASSVGAGLALPSRGGAASGAPTEDRRPIELSFAVLRHTFEAELDLGIPLRPLLIVDYVHAELRARGEDKDKKQVQATESWGRFLPAGGATLFYSTDHATTEIRAAYSPDLSVFDGTIRYRPTIGGRFVLGLGWFHRWTRIGDLRLRSGGPIVELSTSF